VGVAQLHHCKWKCTVYSTDPKTKNRRCEVVHIDKDMLHPAHGEPVAAPESKPKGTKVGQWLNFFRPRLINEYSSDPNERIKAVLNQSEDLKEVRDEWERVWFQDQPSKLTPKRVPGEIK